MAGKDDLRISAQEKAIRKSLLTEEDTSVLESFQGKTDGYFGKMLLWLMEFIENSASEGRFTQEEASEDLDIALFICRALEADLDCSRLKIAAKGSGGEEYTLIYSADGSDDFSL